MKDERKWVCAVCHAVFDEHEPLHQHIQRKHQEELRILNETMQKYKEARDKVN